MRVGARQDTVVGFSHEMLEMVLLDTCKFSPFLLNREVSASIKVLSFSSSTTTRVVFRPEMFVRTSSALHDKNSGMGLIWSKSTRGGVSIWSKNTRCGEVAHFMSRA